MAALHTGPLCAAALPGQCAWCDCWNTPDTEPWRVDHTDRQTDNMHGIEEELGSLLGMSWMHSSFVQRMKNCL
jgi:hypothetical protein